LPGREAVHTTQPSAGEATPSPPKNLEWIFSIPALQLPSERLLLFTLVFSLKPRCCLEIGTHSGGSAAIICAALDDVGAGQLVSVDAEPAVDPVIWDRAKARMRVVRGWSPHILPDALAASPDKFDFVLIDGDHSYASVLGDIEGVLPCLADRAHILFHDAHYVDVKEGVDEALRRYPEQLHDSGLLSVDEAAEETQIDGQRVTWGGLRLVMFTRVCAASAPPSNRLRRLEEQLRATETELRAAQQHVRHITGSLTWRVSSAVAYSRAGKAISFVVRRLARAHAVSPETGPSPRRS
jgi:predicted O-methyltransferase YrrM